jgi:hypothetical protein
MRNLLWKIVWLSHNNRYALYFKEKNKESKGNKNKKGIIFQRDSEKLSRRKIKFVLFLKAEVRNYKDYNDNKG